MLFKHSSFMLLAVCFVFAGHSASVAGDSKTAKTSKLPKAVSASNPCGCPPTYSCSVRHGERRCCKRVDGGVRCCKVNSEGVYDCRGPGDHFTILDCTNEANLALQEANDTSKMIHFEANSNTVNACNSGGDHSIFCGPPNTLWASTTRVDPFAVFSMTSNDGYEYFAIGASLDPNDPAEEKKFLLRDY
jgi:hypothetical protein